MNSQRKNFNSAFLWRFLRAAFIVVCIILFLFPLYYTVSLSLKSEIDAFTYPPKWIFIPTLRNYTVLFYEDMFARNLLNSIIISTTCVAVSMVLGAPMAFGLSRSRSKWVPFVMFAILAVRVMPPMSILIPVFSIYVKLGLADTFFGVVLMYLTFTLPLCIWMMKVAYDRIPLGIEEAGRIDGCSTLSLFLRVSFPIAAEAAASTAIIIWVYSWNEFLYALILTRSTAKTAPVLINSFMNFESIRWGQITSAAVIVSSPVFLFGILVRKYLVNGLTAGAVKE